MRTYSQLPMKLELQAYFAPKKSHLLRGLEWDKMCGGMCFVAEKKPKLINESMENCEHFSCETNGIETLNLFRNCLVNTAEIALEIVNIVAT